MTRAILRGIEIGLFGVGAALAVWCAWVLVQAELTQRMPVPEPEPEPLTITQSLPSGVKAALPGDRRSRKTVPLPTRGAWVARLEAPTVKMRTTVLEGSDDGTLDRGAGHIEETSLPGQIGNIGIAGHRDTVFRSLRHVQIGDPLQLTTRDRVFHFRITKLTIVGPKDVHVLDPTPEPTLTLVTCYPFEFIGRAPRRFIVRARLVNEEVRMAAASTPGPPAR